MATACSAISLITRSPLQARAISSAPTSTTEIPSPALKVSRCALPAPRTIGDFAQGLWSSLNPDNKVSLFARVIDLDSGETGDMIFNKYDAVCSDLDDPEEPELLPEELELLKKLDAEEKQD